MWKQKIERLGQVAAVECREGGHHWSDNEVFEALLLAVLSNNTEWTKIERVLAQLRVKFSDFNLDKYAEATDDDVIQQYLPWLQKHKAGSMTLAHSLISLAMTTRLLRKWSTQHGSAEDYFLSLISSFGGHPRYAAVELGRPDAQRSFPVSEWRCCGESSKRGVRFVQAR